MLERRRIRAPGERLRFFDDAIYVLEGVAAGGRTRWPSPDYRDDPARFFREVLGIEPWARQVELLEAIRDNARVACKSGHRVAKSNSCAGAGLWFYCSFEDARVILTAPTMHQVDDVLWLETRKMHVRSGKCVACKAEDPHHRTIPVPCPHSTVVDGAPNDLARSGLVSADFREIRG